MNNKVYDVLKWLALVAFDAFGVAYQSLAEVWNLPCGDQVFKTAVILSVLVGTLIGVSGMRYTTVNDYEDEIQAEEVY